MQRHYIGIVALLMLAGITAVKAQQPEMTFDRLPQIIQKEVKGVRAKCTEMRRQIKGREKESYEGMSGIKSFYLGSDKNVSILVEDLNVCNQYNILKGANCHTQGCDVRIYRPNASGQYVKYFRIQFPANSFLALRSNMCSRSRLFT